MEAERSHLSQIDPRKARFPCCIVWTPIPFITWLVPFIGHIGICREDGVKLDFAGPNFVSVDNFAFGAVARYIQVNGDEVCFLCGLYYNSCGIQRPRHTISSQDTNLLPYAALQASRQ
jgi:hypothetical protein